MTKSRVRISNPSYKYLLTEAPSSSRKSTGKQGTPGHKSSLFILVNLLICYELHIRDYFCLVNLFSVRFHDSVCVRTHLSDDFGPRLCVKVFAHCIAEVKK